MFWDGKKGEGYAALAECQCSSFNITDVDMNVSSFV